MVVLLKEPVVRFLETGNDLGWLSLFAVEFEGTAKLNLLLLRSKVPAVAEGTTPRVLSVYLRLSWDSGSAVEVLTNPRPRPV